MFFFSKIAFQEMPIKKLVQDNYSNLCLKL